MKVIFPGILVMDMGCLIPSLLFSPLLVFFTNNSRGGLDNHGLLLSLQGWHPPGALKPIILLRQFLSGGIYLEAVCTKI